MSDWSIVGYSSDPIPDDPDIVAAQIEHILGVARDIRTQVERLPSSGDVEALRWNDNTAATSFKQCCQKLPTDLNELNTRYSAVGGALTTFNVTLRSTKAAAQANLVRATNAHAAIGSAQAGVTQMNDFKTQATQQAATQNAHAAKGATPVTPATWTGPDYQGQLTTATTDFNNAKTAIDQAVAQFHHACSNAEDAVNTAIHDGLKNHTGFWHWAGNLLGSAAHAIASHLPLRAIASVCGQLAGIAALLSFIPVVGQVADVVALSLGAVAITAQAIQTVNDAYEGTFTWSGDGMALLQDAGNLIPGAKEAEDAENGLRLIDTVADDSGDVETLAHDGTDLAASGTQGKTLDLFYKRGWSPAQKAEADMKVDQLDQLAKDGKLVKTTPDQRLPSVRKEFIGGGQVPPGQEVDHIHELQLGGQDEVGNLQYLDKSVNRSVGSQIMNRTKDAQIGDTYNGVTIQVRPPRLPRLRAPKVPLSTGPSGPGITP